MKIGHVREHNSKIWGRKLESAVLLMARWGDFLSVTYRTLESMCSTRLLFCCPGHPQRLTSKAHPRRRPHRKIDILSPRGTVDQKLSSRFEHYNFQWQTNSVDYLERHAGWSDYSKQIHRDWINSLKYITGKLLHFANPLNIKPAWCKHTQNLFWLLMVKIKTCECWFLNALIILLPLLTICKNVLVGRISGQRTCH